MIDILYNDGKVDIERFKEQYPNLDVYWETLAALGAATGTREFVDYALENEGGRINMCTALENLKEEGIEEGKIRGAVEILLEMGLTQEEICERIEQKYHISKEDAVLYLKKAD